ncbi:hypothetical protein BC829DRAFT_410374 [Chytridium lagenaria]|nr:hypothetical protein BC829DRAFT_410374 [Chytridium lagenaria]
MTPLHHPTAHNGSQESPPHHYVDQQHRQTRHLHPAIPHRLLMHRDDHLNLKPHATGIRMTHTLQRTNATHYPANHHSSAHS